MHKFEFARKTVKLEFPDVDYTITVDGLVRSRSVEVSQWMIAEGERRRQQMEKESNTAPEQIFKQITDDLCKYIDEFLGDGAHERILGERLSGTPMCIYQDVCDIMGYILGSIRDAWEDMHPAGKTGNNK